MSYLPFILLNAVILGIVGHVFMRAVAERNLSVARDRRAMSLQAYQRRGGLTSW